MQVPEEEPHRGEAERGKGGGADALLGMPASTVRSNRSCRLGWAEKAQGPCRTDLRAALGVPDRHGVIDQPQTGADPAPGAGSVVNVGDAEELDQPLATSEQGKGTDDHIGPTIATSEDADAVCE